MQHIEELSGRELEPQTPGRKPAAGAHLPGQGDLFGDWREISFLSPCFPARKHQYYSTPSRRFVAHLNRKVRRYYILVSISVLLVAVFGILLGIEYRNNSVASEIRSRERQLFALKPWNRSKIKAETDAAYESISKLWDIYKTDSALHLDQMIALMDPASLAVRYPKRFYMLRNDPKVICYFSEGCDLRPRSIRGIFNMVPYNNKIEVILVVDENKDIVVSKGLVSPYTVGDSSFDFYNKWK